MDHPAAADTGISPLAAASLEKACSRYLKYKNEGLSKLALIFHAK